MRKIRCWLSLSGILLMNAPLSDAAENIRGIFDVAPVSHTNPVIAGIKDYGIEISAAEFQAYVQSEASADEQGKTLTAAGKHAALNDLLDEYFLVEWALQKGAEQTPGFKQTMDNTRRMLLQAALEMQEVQAKAKNAGDYPILEKNLHDRIFDRVDVRVFNGAYNELQTIVTHSTISLANLDTIAGRQRPLAQCNGLTISIGDILQAWLNHEPSQRPDLQTKNGLTAILKEILDPSLMIAEARARGLEQAPFMREKLELNRAALLRFYAQDRITDRAVAQMKAPEIKSQLQQWFTAHLKDRYTYKDENGKDRAYSFEAEQARIADDYFENLREKSRADLLQSLHAGHPVQIDETLLDQTVVSLPAAPAPDAELASSVIAWDADVKEHIVKTGDTNASFTFQLANVSSGDVIIDEVQPLCECTTVKLPGLPWKLKPGDKGEIRVTVDLQGRTNSFNRSIHVDSSSGGKTLTLKITAPAIGLNMQQATAYEKQRPGRVPHL